jgi:hypothetical protein
MRRSCPARLPLLKENFRKLTVGHGSTKFFRRAEIFAKKFSRRTLSKPSTGSLSSVENVTATRMMQRYFGFAIPAKRIFGENVFETEKTEQ